MTLDWSQTQLGQVGRWLSGGTPSLESSEYWGGSVPWASAKDMKCFELWDTEDHITEKGLEKGSRAIGAGDLLIVVRGMILAHTFPVAIAMTRMAFNQDIKAIRCQPHVDPRFLAHWLVGASARILTKVTDTSHGTKRFDVRQLQRHSLLLPPHDEQRTIARILDAVDIATEKTRVAIAATGKLMRAVLQAFFEQGLGRISSADRPGKKLRKGWRLVPTKELLVRDPKNGISPVTSPQPPGYPTFSIAAVRNGKIDLMNEEHRKYVRIRDEVAAEFAVNRGDLLIVRGNANPELVGRCGMVADHPEGCIYPDILKRVVFRDGDDGLIPEYACIAWNHPVVHNQVLKLAKTSNGTLKINSKDVKQIIMPVPPKPEQEQLVELVGRAEKSLQCYQRQAVQLERLKRGLMQDLLTGRVRVKLPAASSSDVVRSRP